MINHRIATERACSVLFGSNNFSDFITYLDMFVGQIKEMAGQAQYTMISHAVSTFDQSFLSATYLDNDRVIAVLRHVPLSLPACLKALDYVDSEGAREIAKNIAKHETFPVDPNDDIFIDDVVKKLSELGFAENTPIILDKLFRVPYENEEFDYNGFVASLYRAFKSDCRHTIDWAIGFESKLMETELPSLLSNYSNQTMGNIFYKKGLKSLGKVIMEDTAESSRAIELHERDKFLGLRIPLKSSNAYDVEARICYWLGSDVIEPEWFDIETSELSGKSIERAVDMMQKSTFGYPRENLDVVFGVSIANCYKTSMLKDMVSYMEKLSVFLPEALASFSLNKCLKYFIDKPSEVMDIMKIAGQIGAKLDFSPYSEKIASNVKKWTGAQLTAGDILACHFGSRDGFPCDVISIANAVDGNWNIWNDKERRIALDQLPYEVLVKSRHLKGLKLSDELGL